jgi:hypothetical protein
MKKAFSVVLMILFVCSVMVIAGCGKGDKVKLVEQMKKFTEFMKTDEYKNNRKDVSAMGKKAEEFAKAVGFKDYMECIKAKQKYMSDPEIQKLDKEQWDMNAKLEEADKTATDKKEPDVKDVVKKAVKKVKGK